MASYFRTKDGKKIRVVTQIMVQESLAKISKVDESVENNLATVIEESKAKKKKSIIERVNEKYKDK